LSAFGDSGEKTEERSKRPEGIEGKLEHEDNVEHDKGPEAGGLKHRGKEGLDDAEDTGDSSEDRADAVERERLEGEDGMSL
jgi:hypothetical protein